MVRDDRSADPAPRDLSASEVRAEFEERLERLRRRHLPDVLRLFEDVVRDAGLEGSTLADMCRYQFETGGKRLRALLPLLVADCLGEDPGKTVAVGAACEMLHNATLVHDDVQDGDESRRGRETVWRRFGVARAIDLGNAMFYFTLLLAQRTPAPVESREALARRILVETLRVIDGQEQEFALRANPHPTLVQYCNMVEAKTSRLFVLTTVGSAEVLGQPARVLDSLGEGARHLGILFQIQDDLLDLYGDKGRDRRGGDIAEGKRSILAVHALENAPADDARRLLAVLDKERTETTSDDVDRVIGLFDRIGSLSFAVREMHARRRAAVAAVAEHRRLSTLMQGISETVLDPIRVLVQRFS